jgi:cytochrome c-type biogenesis protein CcmH/NrfG
LPSTTKAPVEKPTGLFASPEKRNAVACLLLAVATLALYNPVNHHPFVNYDDDRYVTENAHVRQGLTADTFKWALTATEQANWHPLTWMSHALDCSMFRLNPSGHHFSSVLLHALNAVLLFLVLMWSTRRFGPSLFVAALFGLHPIEVESVVWVAERKNVLCTMFFFLTLWAYGWYARKPGWKRYLAVTALFAAGLASKPMVITLPFVLLLLDYWPLQRVGDSGASAGQSGYSWAKLAIEKLPLLALSVASAMVTMHAQQTGGAVRTIEEFSFGTRIANAVYSYAMYLWKMVWPMRLAPLYPHRGTSLATWQVFIAALVLIASTGVVVKFRTRRYLLVGWLWFLGTLVPVIGLVQVGEASMADRYAYIPLIGIFVMFAFAIADWADARKLDAWPAVAGAVVLLALAALTHRQIGYWQSNEVLWSHTLAVTENNFVAEDNLGGALILEDKEEEAHPHFEAAARINPRDAMSRSNLGTYFQTHNHMREAISQYEAAVELTTDPILLAQTYANMGAAHRALGEDELAQKKFEQSLTYNSGQFNAWLGLGLIAQNQGKIGEAITDLSHSVESQPTAEAYFQLGRMLMQTGHAPEAIGAYQEALKISPDLGAAQQAIDSLRQPK